jgi:hypothetical protein
MREIVGGSLTQRMIVTLWILPSRLVFMDSNTFANLSVILLNGKSLILEKLNKIHFFLSSVFWLLAFLTGLIMAGWLISEVWLNYLSSPLIVTFEPFETTIDKIPFPAVTSKTN